MKPNIPAKEPEYPVCLYCGSIIETTDSDEEFCLDNNCGIYYHVGRP